MPIRRVLIANRGEIARRIHRSATALGIETVYVYSDADALNSFLDEVTLKRRLPGESASETYLNAELLLKICGELSCDAIHPGYGFLSEDSAFAKAVETAGITWIGPSSETLHTVGDKVCAREAASEAGLPLIPGTSGDALTDKQLSEAAKDMALPLLVKAAGGGGGRGMRLVNSHEELRELLKSARKEAKTFFGSDAVYIEKQIPESRHIEVQVAGDGKGKAIHLFERECSLQRRFQKVIEEAPASFLSEATRAKLHQYAVTFASHCKLKNLATIEFLVDASSDEIYFLEANPRLQVEHPVTECITGLDLVALQFDIATGKPLPKQSDVTAIGHAIQARIYAEDPYQDFQPTVGTLSTLVLPETERIDHALTPGLTLTTNYDSMLAKVIVHKQSREEAIVALREALLNTVLLGTTTNLSYLYYLLADSRVTNQATTTNTLPLVTNGMTSHINIEKLRDDLVAAYLLLTARSCDSESFLGTSLCLQVSIGDNVYRCSVDTFRIEPRAKDSSFYVSISVEGNTHTQVLSRSGCRDFLAKSSAPFSLYYQDETNSYRSRCYFFTPLGLAVVEPVVEQSTASGASAVAEDIVISPLPGTIVQVKVANGESVKANQALFVLESMKMEHQIIAPVSGTVDEISVTDSQAVKKGEPLCRVQAN